MKRKFKVKSNRIILARWEDDEGWTEIHLEREWKEMIERAYKISKPKNNKDLLRHLIVAVPKKKHC